MYDRANWELSDTVKSEIETGIDDDKDVGRASGGWWILPGAFVGSLGWIGIFYIVFK